MSPYRNPHRQYGFIGEDKHTQNDREVDDESDVEYEDTPPPRKATQKINQPKQPLILTLIMGIFRGIWVTLLFIFQTLWALCKGVGALFLGILGLTRFIGDERKAAMKQSLWKIILWGVGLGTVAMVLLVLWVSKDLPDPNRITDRNIAQSTKIYDRTGEHILYEVYADEKRTLVTIDQLPQHLIDGVIATEDTKFYEHAGVRPLSFIRAAVFGLLPGRRAAGTSTLTQQLVKNAILTNERSYIRKLKEVILSLRLEQKYTKDQILQIYFNEIPYGSTNFGVETAAQSYFGKSVSDLNLQEAATLAGFPKAPSRYLNNPEALLERRNFVLRRMAEEGYITEEEKVAAQNEPLTLSRTFSDMKAPHFVLYVKEQLVEKFGEQLVDTGGLKVITTLDWKMQEAAETVIENASSTMLASNANNTALLAMDPKTGQILTMVGSRDFYDDSIDGQFNVATLGKRQPGSSFKPIIYAAAFEKGYTPDTILYDVNTNFGANGSTPYEPRNYDLSERGPVTIRTALQGSLNIPAVKALYLVGEKKGIEFSERLGYTTLSEGEFGLSLVLGGGEVKLIDHVNAFAAFANNGVQYDTVSILSVEDSTGDMLFEWKRNKGEEVVPKEVAHTLSNVLSDDAARAYVFGAGGVLTLPDRPVAAKTGTTNSYVDAWTVGYTPNLVAGVWAGNTNNTPMKQGDGGSRVAAPIWQGFMKAALAGKPVEAFPEPPLNDATKPVLRGSSEGGARVSINRVTGKIATSSTPPDLIEEKTFIQPHDILHYVIKDDPRGPIPENPADDPQYSIWENAIADWIRRKQESDPSWSIEFGEAPTELDEGYDPALLPTLEITFPNENSTLTTRELTFQIQTDAPRGVQKAIYSIDGKTIDTVRSYPFTLSYYAASLESGIHTLSVSVEDDKGNRTTKERTFTLAVGTPTPAATFDTPPSTLLRDDAPWRLSLRTFQNKNIQKITITGTHNGTTKTIGEINNLQDILDGRQVFLWNNTADQGEWILQPVVYTTTGDTLEMPQISVTIE
jgi:1A family penicillin-binding protein